nr:hypothetical protein [Tanacetum cinerariifolium]
MTCTPRGKSTSGQQAVNVSQTQSDHRSTTGANDGDRQSMVAIGGQWWRSTMVAGGGPSLTTVGPSQLAGHRTGQFGSWIGFGSGPPRGMPRVSHVCLRRIYVDADVDITTHMGVEPRTSSLTTQGLP